MPRDKTSYLRWNRTLWAISTFCSNKSFPINIPSSFDCYNKFDAVLTDCHAIIFISSYRCMSSDPIIKMCHFGKNHWILSISSAAVRMKAKNQ